MYENDDKNKINNFNYIKIKKLNKFIIKKYEFRILENKKIIKNGNSNRRIFRRRYI